jgi:hypothetical protein
MKFSLRSLRSLMWEHSSLRISIAELIELRLALIFLMSSWFWWVLAIKVLSSWACVVAIWKNEQANGIIKTKGVCRGGWDHMEGCKMTVSTTIRVKMGIQWDRGQIRVSKKGRVHKTNCVKNHRYHWNQGEERDPVG